METVRFLRDIEDEEAFGQALELAYIDAYNYVTGVGNRMQQDTALPSKRTPRSDNADRLKELRKVLFTMSLVIRDVVDRRRRLANVAAGTYRLPRRPGAYVVLKIVCKTVKRKDAKELSSSRLPLSSKPGRPCTVLSAAHRS